VKRDKERGEISISEYSRAGEREIELINYSPVIMDADIVSVSCEVDDRSDLNRQSDLSEKKKSLK
jgi:hypothetical protein